MMRKILFVDDDRVLQLVAQQQLAVFAEHFSLTFANDGLEAIKKLENGCFSLVCIDLIMPRMKGADLFSHIRSHYPHLPVIIFSSTSKEEMQKRIPPVGVLEYFRKPFIFNTLGTCIMQHLQKEADGGIMYNVSPPVFFQFMEMEAKTCTACVLDNGSHQGGILYFHEGQLLEVRVGVKTGLEAAHEAFGWNDVTVFIEKNCSEKENKINLPLQTVIMQAVSMKDEDLEQEGELGCSVSLECDTSPTSRTSQLAEIRQLLAGEVAADRINDMQQRIEMTDAMRTITKIGKNTGFGGFHIGILNHGDDNENVIIPGEPPIEIQCSSAGQTKEVVRILEGKS